MDIASLVGMLLGLAMIIFGIVSGEQGVAALVNFIHIPSFLITQTSNHIQLTVQRFDGFQLLSSDLPSA